MKGYGFLQFAEVDYSILHRPCSNFYNKGTTPIFSFFVAIKKKEVRSRIEHIECLAGFRFFLALWWRWILRFLSSSTTDSCNVEGAGSSGRALWLPQLDTASLIVSERCAVHIIVVNFLFGNAKWKLVRWFSRLSELPALAMILPSAFAEEDAPSMAIWEDSGRGNSLMVIFGPPATFSDYPYSFDRRSPVSCFMPYFALWGRGSDGQLKPQMRIWAPTSSGPTLRWDLTSTTVYFRRQPPAWFLGRLFTCPWWYCIIPWTVVAASAWGWYLIVLEPFWISLIVLTVNFCSFHCG